MNTAEERSDERLMERLSEGEDIALEALVRRYQNDLFRFCLHYVRDIEVAKEMSQETFLRVYGARARFDVSRKFKPWLLCIARNLCLNELKRKKAVRMEALEQYADTRVEGGAETSGHIEGADVTMMTAERRLALLETLNELPDEAREMIVLRYFERLSAREIAGIVDSTEGAVRTRLHRILKQLRDRWESIRDDL